MSLLAYNLTTFPLKLAAVQPPVHLKKSSAAGMRGPSEDVTDELRGLAVSAYTAIQAQVDGGLAEFAWCCDAEYPTPPLVVRLPAVPSEPFTVHVDGYTGADTNPGSVSKPVATLERAMDLAAAAWKSRLARIKVAGTVEWKDPTLSNLNVGKHAGTGTPLLIEGGLLDALGTLTAAPGATPTVITASSGAVVRRGAAASIIATGSPPTNLMRLTGVTGWTLADKGRQVLVRRANAPGNNGTFTIDDVDSAGITIDVINTQAVLPDTNNGHIYWQESFEGATLQMTGSSSPLKDQARSIVEHGLAAGANITAVAGSQIIDGETFSLVDSLGQSTTFEFVTGARLPAANVKIGFSATDSVETVAESILAAILKLVDSPIGHTMQITPWRLEPTKIGLRQNEEGSDGNRPNSDTVAHPGFVVTDFTGGKGTLPGTFVLNSAFVVAGQPKAPVAGDPFVVQLPSAIIKYGTGPKFTQVIECGGGALGLKDIVFENQGSLQLTFRTANVQLEGVHFRLNGRTLTLANGATLAAGVNAAYSQWQNSGATNPFSDAARLGKATLIRDGTLNINAGSRINGHWITRHVMINATNGFVAVNTLFGKRTAINARDSRVSFTNASRLEALPSGVPAIDAIIALRNGSVADSLTNLEVNGSDKNAVLLTGNSTAAIGSVSGERNRGTGLSVAQGSECTVVASSAPTRTSVTGNAADLKVGQRATRSWLDFNSKAPVGIESDVAGDASRVQVNGVVAPGLTQLVTGGATPGIAAGPGAGAAPAALAVTGDDVTGTITLTTNGADTPAPNADIVVVTFARPYPAASLPRVLVVPANDSAWALAPGLVRYRQADTTTKQFRLRDGPVPLPPLQATTYVWNYHVLAR